MRDLDWIRFRCAPIWPEDFHLGSQLPLATCMMMHGRCSGFLCCSHFLNSPLTSPSSARQYENIPWQAFVMVMAPAAHRGDKRPLCILVSLHIHLCFFISRVGITRLWYPWTSSGESVKDVWKKKRQQRERVEAAEDNRQRVNRGEPVWETGWIGAVTEPWDVPQCCIWICWGSSDELQ